MFLLAATLTATSAVCADDGLVLTSVVHGSALPEPAKIRLRAIRTDGSGSPIERMISVPGTATLDLPEGIWELVVESPDFWAAPVYASTKQASSLDLWPVGVFRGTVKTEPHGMQIKELRVAFAAAAEDTKNFAPTGVAPCAVERTQWRCRMPAGVFDVRLLSPGFAAEFRWSQQIREGEEVDWGQLTLRRGASLFGFVAGVRGVDFDLGKIAVTARPRSLSPETARHSYASIPNRRGFFQIIGLPPGDYVIQAAGNGLRSEKRPASIVEDKNAELRSPLLLESPRKIILTIDPASPFEGATWHIRLYAHPTDSSRMEEVVDSNADSHGRWSAEVTSGRYLLEIGRADESIWSSNEVTVASADVLLNLTVAALKVKGKVTLGDRTLSSARLIFGGENGPERQTLVTDEEGRFLGEIPVRKTSGKTWEITVDADEPRVHRTAKYEAVEEDDGDLRFLIELPWTIVKGRVVNDDGTAEPQSIVTLRSEDNSVFEQATAGPDGVFELFGFEPGSYRIHADAFQRSSKITGIEARGVETPVIEVVLVLEDEVRIRGRVRSASFGVVGARLTALPRDTTAAFVPSASTDANGNFELKLPPQTRTFDLVVVAPGFALSAGRVLVRDEKMLTITVGQSGGGLVLEIPSGDAVIRHDGAEFPARWLTALSGGSVEMQDDFEIASLRDVEAGEYTVCANGRCRTGIVAPHGSLDLSLREHN